MKKFLVPMIFLVSFGLTHILTAQEQKPKVALVLSGGGAKGIAHIPLLQALDSLGIAPDIIIGTSMGSVVGGLYAVGYSGDSIAKIAHKADWEELLGGDISFRDVSMEEKSEFKSYLVDLDVLEGKPKVNVGLLKDQKLREFISSLTYPVYNIRDFDELPTPYRAMTTDIVNGQEVFLEKGSLATAMRASMSIPGVFEPVAYNNTLLVDGGVLNNFPVDRAKEMGYDIIIGSDVGGGMQTKDKLSSIPALLFQTGMITSNLKNPKSREMCDILIDHIPNLTYSTGDFNKSDGIYEEGKLAVQTEMDALVALADKLKNFKQRAHQLPDVKDEYLVDTIIFNDISEANLDLVKAKLNIQVNHVYSTQELIDAIDRAMGTNLFRQMTYSAEEIDDKVALTLNGFEHSQHQVKGSLHYDSFRNVGIVLNYTGRNVIGDASRFLVSVDVSQQPRFRVQYQKQFGPVKNWWWRSEVFGQFLNQNFYLQGEQADDFKSRYVQFDNYFNKNFESKNSYAGIRLSYEYTNLVPKFNPLIKPNIFGLESYIFKNLEIGAHYLRSNFNKVYFPTDGSFFNLEIARSLFRDLDMHYSIPDFQPVSGATNGFTKFGLEFEKRWAISKKTTGIFGAKAKFIFIDDLDENENSLLDFGYAVVYGVGGLLPSPRRSSVGFPGLYEDEIFAYQLMKINLALQVNPFSKVYVTPHVDIGSVGYGTFDEYIKDAFSPSGHWSDGNEPGFIMSAGSNFSFNSFMGPVNIDVSWVNDINKVRVFFSVGLILNRSN